MASTTATSLPKSLGGEALSWLWFLSKFALVPLSVVGVLALIAVFLSLGATKPEELWTIEDDNKIEQEDKEEKEGEAIACESRPRRTDSNNMHYPPAQTNSQYPPAGTSKAATSSPRIRRKKTLTAQVSTSVSDAAVRAAILLKQSPIPDTIAKWTSNTVTGYSRVDSAFGIHERVSKLSQVAVQSTLTAASIAGKAALLAGVAYQTAPGYKEIHGYETEYDSDDSSGSEALIHPLEVYEASNDGRKRNRPVPALSHKASIASIASKKTLLPGASEILPDVTCVRIVKLDTSIPGSFPGQETREISTSTDPCITGIGNIQNQDEACLECGRVGPSRVTLFNDIASQFDETSANDSLHRESSGPTIFGSLYTTGTTVAGRVVTASSTYFLGKETTDILMGSNDQPQSQAQAGQPMSQFDAFVHRATRGVYSATSLKTLMKARGSKLKKWFTGINGKCDNLDEETVKEWMRDGVMMKDGTFFIDRDGTHFHHIINHLRGLALSPALDSRVALYELRQEALFYNIVPLIVEIDERLPNLDRRADIAEEKIIPLAFSRSTSPQPFGSSGTTSQTVSPEPKASLMNFSTAEMVRDPMESGEGLRQRKFTPTNATEPLAQSQQSVSPISPYALPTTSSLVSSAFSLASSFLLPQSKPLILANPDSDDEKDRRIRQSPKTQQTNAAAEMESATHKQSSTAPQISLSWKSIMSRSHEETLHRLLTKRRQWRIQLESKTKSIGSITEDQRQEINAIQDQRERGENDETVIGQAVRLLNKSTWRNISGFNASRVQQGSVFTPYSREIGGGCSYVPAGDLAEFVESCLIRIGVLCGLPPPPRNDVVMNIAWAAGCGAALAIEVTIIFLLLANEGKASPDDVNHAVVSIFDMFSIGVGPSSSHTVGPMRAARIFVKEAEQMGFVPHIHQIRVDLYGSLALTGVGHGTPGAILMGLEGDSPELIDAKSIPTRLENIKTNSILNISGKSKIAFNYEKHLVFHYMEALPQHPNGMRITCYDKEGDMIATNEFFSIGGGFVINEPIQSKRLSEPSTVALSNNNSFQKTHGDDNNHLITMLPFSNAQSLLEVCQRENMSIAEVVFRNELQWRDAEDVKKRTLNLWNVMDSSIVNGITSSEEYLPGKLRVKRRAPFLHRKLMAGFADYAGMNLGPKQKSMIGGGSSTLDSGKKSELTLAYKDLARVPKELKRHLPALDWISMYALAVNEENAAGGRVVTAPTNGAAGTIPAVLKPRLVCSTKEALQFLLPEMGCQGEVGVACSMAAGAFAAVMGGTVEQVENAAEIGMERNALAAVKAITAAQLSLNGDGTHRVHLDQVIATMRQTGMDMMTKYKETSQGGLAVNVPVC
ncbi:serine dehydratase beta chain-domain-containing protein [Obelidium mucronatum]|nr:serine dehydratase beta chain-domain-containing protein [Obelidium mucronatum]